MFCAVLTSARTVRISFRGMLFSFAMAVNWSGGGSFMMVMVVSCNVASFISTLRIYYSRTDWLSQYISFYIRKYIAWTIGVGTELASKNKLQYMGWVFELEIRE